MFIIDRTCFEYHIIGFVGISSTKIFRNAHCRYMAEILSIRRKTLYNQTIGMHIWQKAKIFTTDTAKSFYFAEDIY